MFGSAVFAALPDVSVAGVVYLGQHEIQLVEDRANEVSIPHLQVEGIDTRQMEWDDPAEDFIAAASSTRISEFVLQLQRRYKNSQTLDPTVVARCETVDADTGNRLVFTPGATVVGSAQDFEVIIPDQLGGYESRGFLVFLATDANNNPGVDGGEVILRLTPQALPLP